jgi:tRNA(Ile)-lysidine synthase
VRSRPPAAADGPPPLRAAEFARLLDPLGPFELAPCVAVAVSGGPDSMALALLADCWARDRGGAVLGLIVDHGLRTQSAVDADSTVASLSRLGIPAQVLEWSGAKPVTGIQAKARAARYALLEAACRSEGILHLMLGHQREDQAETAALRAESGSGRAGLAAMAAVREVHGLRLLRPLLAIPKARLVATLQAASVPWLQDPANTAARFARTRLRQDSTFATERHWSASHACAVARHALDRWLADWLARHARPHALGFVRLDRGAWLDLDGEHRAMLLARVLATVGGHAYPPRGGLLRRVAAARSEARLTVGGCIVACRNEELLVMREAGRASRSMVLRPGEEGMWDGRFAVAYVMGTCPIEVRALGPDGVQQLPGTLRRRLRASRVPAAALHGLPSAWAAARLVGCPTVDAHELAGAAGFSITASPRPSQPLAGPAFAGVNVVSKPQTPIYRPGTERDHAAVRLLADPSPRCPGKR